MMKTKAWMALGLAVCMTGCASMSDRDRTEAQATGIGAAVGAVLGAIIGNQMDNPRAGAMIGGMVGAVAGNVYGNHVAARKAEFAKEEDYLNACLAQAQKVNAEAVAGNTALRGEIAGLNRRVDEMLAAIQNRTAERGQKTALMQDLRRQRQAANRMLAQVTEEIRVQRELLKNEANSGAAPQLAAIQEQIDQLERQKADLTAQTNQLAALSNRMSV